MGSLYIDRFPVFYENAENNMKQYKTIYNIKIK